MNDVPVRETGHNFHAPSPQEAEVKTFMARLKETASGKFLRVKMTPSNLYLYSKNEV